MGNILLHNLKEHSIIVFLSALAQNNYPAIN